jgi:hypothetical protein
VMGVGHQFGGCSDGEGAADDGPRGGRKDAGVFSGEMEKRKEIWPKWWL